jgi:hypothetical protein
MRRDRIVVAVLAAAVAALVAPPTMGDDAAISFRYASRLAHGAGLTYNDHERVLGVSNTLYTLLIALLDRLGLSPPTAARLVGVLSVVAVALIAQELAQGWAGRGTGLLAAGTVLVAAPFVSLATTGLEAGLAAALGLGAFLALDRDREALAGLLAGLALVNKLDAALLVVALVVAARLARGRWPWRLLAAAGAVAVPFALVGLAYYGDLLPHSLTAKLAGDATVTGYHHDPTWPLRLLGPGIVLLAVAGVLTVRTLRRPAAAIGVGLLAWAGLQVLAASVVDLGGTYGWYLAVAIPPVAVTAACARRPVVARSALALGLLVGLANTVSDAIDREDSGDRLERDRMAAGQWLDDHAPPGTVVDTCFGWVAYEAADLVISDRCGLTSEEDPGPPTFLVEAPVGDDPDCGPGSQPAATFDAAARQDPEQHRIVVCRAMLTDQ